MSPALELARTLSAEPARALQAGTWHHLYLLLTGRPREEQEAICELLPDSAACAHLRASFLYGLQASEGHLQRLRASLQDAGAEALEQLTVFRMLHIGHQVNAFAHHREARQFNVALGLGPLMRDQAQHIRSQLASVRPRQADAELRRVTLVCTDLGPLTHPATLMAWEHARALRMQGLRVQVLSARETSSARLQDFSGMPMRQALGPHERQRWQQTLGHEVKTWAGDLRHSPLQRWTELWDRLLDFAPDAVIHLGSESPALWLLHPHFPLLHLPTNGLPSEGPADLQLLARPEDWPQDPGWAYAHRAGVAREQVSAGLLEPRQMGCPQDSIRLITAGIRQRPLAEGAWGERMRDLMLRHPRLHWVLLGPQEAPPLLAALKDRVHPLGYQPQMGAFLKSCDLYVNPDRLGGGLSVAMAMACGTATVSLSGTDGGDKLGPYAAPDMDAYFAQLEALLESRAARIEYGAQLRERYVAELDMQSAGPKLMAALKQAQLRFRTRTAGAPS